MKTLKNIAAALLIVLSTTAFAADQGTGNKLEMNYALKTYIDAITLGKVVALPEVLDKDIKFTTTRGEQIITRSRAEMLKSLKLGENVIQNCETSYSIIESTATASVVKVTMKYRDFSKVEYLNLANTGKGWKITSVSTSYV